MIETLRYLKAEQDSLPLTYKDDGGHDMSMVVFQPDRPWVEGEHNLQQQLTARLIRTMVRTIIGRSTLLGTINPSATGVDNELRLHTEDQAFHVAVDGIIKTVYAYDTPVAGTRTVGGNRVTLPAYDGGAGRTDLVFLELWFQEIMADGAEGTADTVVYQDGMEHGFTVPNTLRVDRVPEIIDITRRVQVRGRVRSVPGAGSLTGVAARDNSAFTFGEVGGVWLAGQDTESSARSLDTVDGFVYAIPLLAVERGGDAASFTNLTVVPSKTATLQVLADAALKDLTSVAGQLSAVEQSVSELSTESKRVGDELRTVSDEQGSQGRTLSTFEEKIAAVETKVSVTSKRHTFESDTGSLVTWYGLNPNVPAGTFVFAARVFRLPANHRLKISKVLAGIGQNINTRFQLSVRNFYNVNRTWTWTASQGSLGGFNVLDRSRDEDILDLSEFDRTTDQNIVVQMAMVTDARGAQFVRSSHQSLLYNYGQVELLMEPR